MKNQIIDIFRLSGGCQVWLLLFRQKYRCSCISASAKVYGARTNLIPLLQIIVFFVLVPVFEVCSSDGTIYSPAGATESIVSIAYRWIWAVCGQKKKMGKPVRGTQVAYRTF